jgi:hypothetical protein
MGQFHQDKVILFKLFLFLLILLLCKVLAYAT